MVPRTTRRARRGNYSLMLAITIIALLGFGALAIDTAFMRLALAQSQDISDAASQAALIALRQTGDETLATQAAQRTVDLNNVVGRAPTMSNIEFGDWDDTLAEPEFVDPTGVPNAVRVSVARTAATGDAAPLLLARIWNKTEFDVSASAVSATRSFQIIVVMDITNSWHEDNFLYARQAAVTAFDMLKESASGVDEVGMTVFTNQYSWAFTPLTQISDTALADAVADDWAAIATASKAGTDADPTDGNDCVLNSGAAKNDFTSPEGGCYPNMPREYRDEPGTDHSTGLLQAKEMFEASATGAAYRAVIVITDGRPNGLNDPGTARAAEGYVEDRWDEYVGPAPRTANEIRDASIAATQDLAASPLNTHVWVVSFVADDWMMDQMAQGDGYYTRTSNPAELEDIVAQIISEMPLAIVE